MPPSYDSLHLQPSRRSTFHKTRKGALRSQNWPFPLTVAASKTSSIHPDHLAQAGFYSTPTPDDATVTTCFACEVVVGVWEEGEDPLARHLAAAEEAELECPWAIIQEASWEKTGGLDGKDSETEWAACWGQDGKMHPRGELMQRARKGTFALGWPHHGEKGVPTPEELASAGWYFRPGTTTDLADLTHCPYCIRSVSGWEEGDDPIECHNRKIGEGCPFFLAPLPGSSKAASSKSKRGKASTASSASTSTTVKKEKSKKGKKVVPKVVEEEPEEADVEEEEEEEEVPQEENEPEPLPRTRATRSASVSTVNTAPAPARQTRRAKATPAPSEDETDSAVASQTLKKSTRSRTTTTTNPPTIKSTSRSRKADVDVDVEVEVELPVAPTPATTSSSSSKSSKKGALPSSTSSGSGKSKLKKTVTSPVHEEDGAEEAVQQEEPKKEERFQPRTGQLSADESITDLAMIANAAYELQPSSTEEVEVKKPAKKSKGKSKSSKASTATSSSSKDKGTSQEQVIEVEAEKNVEMEEGQVIKPPKSKEKIAVAETRTQSLPVKTSAPPPPVQDAISPSTSSRQIRSLPSKVNPSKSPSSNSLSAKAGPTSPSEAIPPVPTVSLPAATSSSLPLPWSASTSPKESDNPFAPNRILELLPPPTKEELSTLTVGEWYDLLGRRVQSALKQEMDQMQQGLEKRVEEGRVRLQGMCDEAKAREDAEDRAIEEKRRQKKADKLQASARKHGSARKAVR